ncbi:alanyl-tRNA editing protein [Verrucosispora sp. WMMD703]|uniref:Ala-tRNA(Pro) hydrolase n=1 Tax=Micromonospora sediminimaris TaxID=547162 RepID=A0A9W5XMA2_9ACTN|nr:MULTISPECIES: alanyl-tRNA editing protein [Micromonospora]MBQ1047567.1 alanyl-tRNA editing protein [Micromonospora sp. C51]WFE47844.1 alanyl-tRNA editing protein [Verrucosispora sp. WMMD1129]GIJ35897.1 Ala-tRNA(Pro) hydrolase [Micromonospora sediminimaris]SFD42979.1 misacylated tRNA(Ala) deacylase [Micromonospora sediminimaris]
MGIDHHGRTQRLDWADVTLREWDCTVLWSDPADPDQGIVLDRSAFYPGGGGQPPDHGVLIWQGVQTRIVGTRKGDDLYLLPAPGDPVPPVGTTVTGAIDDDRRSSLMRTHSGLHVLCGTVFRDFNVLVTGSNMEPGEARMDFNLPEIPPGFKQSLEDAVNAEIAADRKIVVRMLSREEANATPDLVRTQFKAPPELPEVRVVDIVGLDVQADGGTHVASTGQIGRVTVTKVESKGRQNRRVRIKLSS